VAPAITEFSNEQASPRAELAVQSTGGMYVIPEGSSNERWIALAIFFITILYLTPFYRYATLDADEGIILAGAQRILKGQVLYRDFFAFYTPGSYYWTALLLRVFGDSILVPRFVLIVYGGLLSSATFLLSRRVCKVAASVAAAVIVSITCLPLSFYVQHGWDSSVLAVLAVYCAVRFIEHPSWRLATLVGSLTSMTIIFEQSKGGGLLLGFIFGFVLIRFRSRFHLQLNWLASAAAGFLIPFVPIGMYFAAHHCLATTAADWVWPLYHYSDSNRLPYGYIPFAIGQYEHIAASPLFWRLVVILGASALVLVATIPFIAAGAFAYLWTQRPSISETAYRFYSLVSGTLVGLFLSVLAGRRDPHHLVYLLPLFAVPLAWLLGANAGPDRMLKFFQIVRPVATIWACTSFFILGFSMLLQPFNALNRLETRRGSLRTKGTDRVLAYVLSHVTSGRKVFVYPYQPLYYYLGHLSNPTSLEFFQPGMHSADQLQAAIRQLDRDPESDVLFSTSFTEMIYIPWPNTPLSVIGRPDPMANYIVRHYRLCASLRSTTNGDSIWLYMVRMGSTCPAELPTTAGS
jgi:Dolichyl-phosphate-mannose-protein mannosyltransferase